MRILNISLFITALSVLSVPIVTNAQLTTTNAGNYGNATWLVDNILLGPGVNASNHTYVGNPAQVGFFTATNVNFIPMDSGIVMSTGHINDAPGPNNNLASTSWGSFTGDPDVTATIGFNTRDCAAIEFDFIATSDTAKFNYAFASDEYSSWVNTSYNDGFGFYISGPGINGPFTNNAKNIALVPFTTNTYVTISNVNNGQWWGASCPTGPCTNCAYWNCNGNGWGSFPPYSTSNLYCNYNGVTDVLTATCPVQCGSTYHIKLVLCDGTDNIYDSGVFLEAGSFASVGMTVGASSTYQNVSGIDTALYEGCGYADITFTRNGDITNPDTVPLDITGTAIEGVDYLNIPDSLYFGASQATTTITLNPQYDLLTEGIETVIITALDSSGCGGNNPEIRFTIHDQIPLVTATQDDTIDCLVDSVKIGVGVISSMPGTNFNWNTTDTTDSLWVSPVQTTQYIVTVTDTCGIQQNIDTVTITVLSLPLDGSVIDAGMDCPGDDAVITAQGLGGYPPYNYQWSNGPTTQTQTVSPTVTTVYYVTITDECPLNSYVDSSIVFVPTYDPIQIFVNDVMVECPGDPVGIDATANGGSGGYIFTWDNWATQTQTITDSIVVNPTTTTTYTVQVTDRCHTDTVSADVTVTVPVFPPLEITISDGIFICPGEYADVWVSAIGGTGTYTYEWSYNTGNTDSVRVYPIEETSYNVIVTDECGTSKEAEVTINMLVPEAEFDYDWIELDMVEFENLSTEDAIIYEWQTGDDYWYNDEEMTHRYIEPGRYKVQLHVTNEYGCVDSTWKWIQSPLKLWVPNSFTPNNDGVNDQFEVVANGLRYYKMVIFNRWGELMFTTQSLDNMWDGKYNGKLVELGTYVYRIEASGFNNQNIEKMGTVTVIR